LKQISGFGLPPNAVTKITLIKKKIILGNCQRSFPVEKERKKKAIILGEREY